MNDYILRCDKCGFCKETSFISMTNCPKCGHSLIIGGENDINPDDLERIEEAQIVNEGMEGCVSDIKQSIYDYGNDYTWQEGEKISLPLARVEFRKIFFQAGGEVPTGKEIQI